MKTHSLPVLLWYLAAITGGFFLLTTLSPHVELQLRNGTTWTHDSEPVVSWLWDIPADDTDIRWRTRKTAPLLTGAIFAGMIALLVRHYRRRPAPLPPRRKLRHQPGDIPPVNVIPHRAAPEGSFGRN
jgi:hypothetical protein